VMEVENTGVCELATTSHGFHEVLGTCLRRSGSDCVAGRWTSDVDSRAREPTG
jgi:hypothetical protein